MITARATFESESGHVEIKKAIAAPETYWEFLAMLFRSGYTMASEHGSEPIYPVFERQMSATYMVEDALSKENPFRSFEVHPTKINGYKYDENY